MVCLAHTFMLTWQVDSPSVSLFANAASDEVHLTAHHFHAAILTDAHTELIGTCLLAVETETVTLMAFGHVGDVESPYAVSAIPVKRP